MSEMSWNRIENNINQRNRFSKQLIEDMVDLLRDSGTNILSEEVPGYYHFTSIRGQEEWGVGICLFIF